MVVLIIDALKELVRDRNTTKNFKHNGDISLDDIIEITKVIRPRSMVKEIKTPGICSKCTFGVSNFVF
ncbi:hypothetical protein ES332_D07G084900v1 [Gossypium tomentosum]|nr:hypothetical protein ES332_D07G084900v1 [Gossypium tomentosum]